MRAQIAIAMKEFCANVILLRALMETQQVGSALDHTKLVNFLHGGHHKIDVSCLGLINVLCVMQMEVILNAVTPIV